MMIFSPLNGATAARRRAHSLQRDAALNPPVRVAASRLPPHTTHAFDDLRGARAHTIAFVILIIHCMMALKAWHVSVDTLDYTAPHVPDLQFDVRALAPSSAANPTRPPGRATEPAPAIAAPARPPSSSPRRTSDIAAPRNTTQAVPSKQLPKTVPNHASRSEAALPAAPEAAAPQPVSSDAGGEPPTASASASASAAKPQDAQPVPEPLTEPSFGAAYLHNPPPAYPGVAQQRGWQGTVLLKVHVQANGRPDHVGLASSSGHDSLDDAAVEAVANWRFVPARRGDQAIDGWVQVPVEFKLGN